MTISRSITFPRTFVFIALLLSTLVSHAQESVYVSDVLYVPMRSGPGTQYRIINAAMKSGTRLVRVENTEDGTWAKVTTSGGTEGWIQNQYLSDERTAQIKLDETVARLARLEKENTELKTQNTALSQDKSTLSELSQQESATKTALADELEKIKQLSSGAIELDRRYRELLQKHEMTQTQRDSLLAENENMRNDQRLSFLLYGAGILVLGIFLAIIVPVLKPKKGYTEWK